MNQRNSDKTYQNVLKHWVLACMLAVACLGPVSAQEDKKTEQTWKAVRGSITEQSHREAANTLREFIRAHAGWDGVRKARLLLGRELVLSGDVTAGKNKLERIIQKAPESAEVPAAYFYTAKAQEAMGNFPGAVLSYQVVRRQFPKHELAPRAALSEALLAEKVLQNARRARRIYEEFRRKYPDHPGMPMVLNHLGVMAEQAADGAARGPTAGFIQEWHVAGPFPNPNGKGFQKSYPPEKKVDLEATYEGADGKKVKWQKVPAKALEENGRVDLTFLEPNQHVCAYAYTTIESEKERSATLYVGSDDGVQAWFNGERVISHPVQRSAEPDQEQVPVKLKKGKNTVLLKITQGGGPWGLFCRVDYKFAWGATAAVEFYTEYARRFPNDTGDPIVNGSKAGAATALWRAGTLAAEELNDHQRAIALRKEYEKLPYAKKGRGYKAAARTLIHHRDAGDLEAMFKAALEARPHDSWLRLHYGRWLDENGKKEQAVEQWRELVKTGRDTGHVKKAFHRLGKKGMEAYLNDHPGDYRAFRLYLAWARNPKRRAAGRKILDKWLERGDIDWKTAIAEQWLEWTGEVEDARRLIDAANQEDLVRASADATLRTADMLLKAEKYEEAQTLLKNSLDRWADYPDFPRAEFALRIGKIARKDPLMVPNPSKKKKADPEKVVSKKAKAAREKGVQLIEKYDLQNSARGARVLADLQRELTPDKAADYVLAAVRKLIDAERYESAAEQMKILADLLPDHDMRLVEALHGAARQGKKAWKKNWKKTLEPLARAELKHYRTVEKPDENSRRALTLLMRAFDPKKSVAAHKDYLKHHGKSAHADRVRRRMFWEMNRAGQKPADAVRKLIKRLEEEPALVRSIPVELIPSGPKGFQLCLQTVREALKEAKGELHRDLLLTLGRLYESKGNYRAALDRMRELISDYGGTDQARAAEDGIIRIMSRGFFAPHVGQKDAERAYARQMKRFLKQNSGTEFSDVAGSLWRLACHPAYRLHGLEEFDSLYLYSAHGQGKGFRNAREFMDKMTRRWPGDGVGPDSNVANKASPIASRSGGAIGSGDKFMVYRWALLRAPRDGTYRIWGRADDWTGLEIDGKEYNFESNRRSINTRVSLSRGLHLCRIGFGDWGGGYSMRLRWEGPGIKRKHAMGPDAFSANRYPLILSRAAANRGAWGVSEWEAYLEKYPNDRRARMMRLETLAQSDPRKALDELNQRIKQYPSNPHYRATLADCLWRLGKKKESLKHYAKLAEMPDSGRWASSYNRLYRRHFLDGETPIGYRRQYQDRKRAAGEWYEEQKEEETENPNERLKLLRSGARRLESLRGQALMRKKSVRRLKSSLGREKSQLESAKKLAAKEDAEDNVRAQARTAVERTQLRIAKLEEELAHAEDKATRAEKVAETFSRILGAESDGELWKVYVEYAKNRLDENRLDPHLIYDLTRELWDRDEKKAAQPLLEYVLERMPLQWDTRGELRWTRDRLVELARQGETSVELVEVMARRGWEDPRDKLHKRWLGSVCDMALETGAVYEFARNAHLLAQLHPKDKKYSGYLDRLGKVFEKAGNYVSAEREYKRVIENVRDTARVRSARLSLAGLYQKLGRPRESLNVLSKFIDVSVPEKSNRNVDVSPFGEDEGEKEVKDEDTEALLLASRCYLMLQNARLAFDAYERAAAQDDFGKKVQPKWQLLVDLARSCVDKRGVQAGQKTTEDGSLPPMVVNRAQKALSMVDATFRFYADKMTVRQEVKTTLIRADANIMMRNFPKAIEEIRKAKKLAKKKPARYLAQLKMGEVHLATDNVQEALSVFKDLAELNREDVSPIALFWLGTTQLKLDKREEAVKAFRKLWERYAGSELVREAVYKIARTYAKQGAFLDAIRLYEAVGAIHSKAREKVVPGEVLTVKVWDADHFLGTGQFTIPVEVRSTCGDTEKVELEMNKINRSLFLGTIRTQLGDPKPNDGILQVFGTDVIYIVYQDKFKDVEPGEKSDKKTTPGMESVRGSRHLSVIQVVHDGDIQVSPTEFVEIDEEDDAAMDREKTEEEKREEERLKKLSARLERGEAVIRPGNMVYLRMHDLDMDRSAERDTAEVTVFTYNPGGAGQNGEEKDLKSIRRRFEDPREVGVSEDIPGNGKFSWSRVTASPPADHPRLDTARVTLTETEPHSGVFHGSVQTDVNGPTAISSDHAGERIPALAIDGKNGAEDAWMGFIDGKPGKWIEVDLKQLHDVARIVWDRGKGANDRYMIDYSVTLRGHGAPKRIKRTGNKSAHNNEIELDKPVTSRWIRFKTTKFEGDAPAISSIKIYDSEGNQIVPPEISPLQRANNKVLEFNVGDCMAAEFVDEENMKPGRSQKRTSNPIGVSYVDGHIDAVYTSLGKNKVRGSVIHRVRNEDQGGKRGRGKPLYGRRTRRVPVDGVLQVAIADPDLDVDNQANSVECEVFSSSGDSAVLTAKEVGRTAGIFTARIQLSPKKDNADSDMILWVRPTDYIKMRYRDEQNRSPGHAVYRNSYVFGARDELAAFSQNVVRVRSPRKDPESTEPPHWEIQLREPDRALPGIDRLEMKAQSFATRDHVRFDVLLQDLGGRFSNRLPVNIMPKPDIEQPSPKNREAGKKNGKNRDKSDVRRIRPEHESGRFAVPLAVSGDDIVYLHHADRTPQEAAERKFIPVVSGRILSDLQALGVSVGSLPETARTEGIEIDLRDPVTVMEDVRASRVEGVTREIAARKLQYRRMLADYDATLKRIRQRIVDLTGEDAQKTDEDSSAKTSSEKVKPPEKVKKTDAPLKPEADDSAEGEVLSADALAASEDIVKAAALRRERDKLKRARKELKSRLDALSRYETKEIEAQLEKQWRAARKRAQEGEEGKSSEGKKDDEPAWYQKTDWWKHAGGLVPGTSLQVRVEDPDLTGETATVVAGVLGGGKPQFYEFEAEAAAEEKGVYTVSILTDPDAEIDGPVVPVDGARSVVLTYRDEAQEEFPTRRAGYLSLASDGQLAVTGPDFVEVKTKHHVGEDIHILVQDADMDKTNARDYVWVEMESKHGDREHVAICETQAHSGIFRGSVPTRFGQPTVDDGTLNADFGGGFQVNYTEDLWLSEREYPPIRKVSGNFVEGSDGTVEAFARQIKRGSLQRDVLFNTARAKYELGKRSTNMGAVQRGHRHLAESREKFRLLVEHYPEDSVAAHATYYLGNIHFLLNEYQEAVESLQRVIDRWPESEFKAKALYKLGTCHLKAGEREKAVDAFVNLAYHHKESPLVADAMLTLAQYFSENDLHRQAIGIGKAFIRKFPSHQSTGGMYLRLGGWLIKMERFEQGAEVLAEAQKNLPDSPYMPAYLYWHAHCLFKTEKSGSDEREKGIILLKRIVYDYPDSKYNRYASARLEETGN